MASFDEIKIESKRYLDYLVCLGMQQASDLSKNEQITFIFELLQETKKEYELDNEFIYAEKIKITRELIRNRMNEITLGNGFQNIKLVG